MAVSTMSVEDQGLLHDSSENANVFGQDRYGGANVYLVSVWDMWEARRCMLWEMPAAAGASRPSEIGL